jgi:DNA polymerase (family 10)
VKIAIGTDSHSAENLNFMQFGVATARRGWLTAGDVMNCLTPSRLSRALKGGR